MSLHRLPREAADFIPLPSSGSSMEVKEGEAKKVFVVLLLMVEFFCFVCAHLFLKCGNGDGKMPYQLRVLTPLADCPVWFPAPTSRCS